MGFRYFFQFFAMLIGPVVTLVCLYVIYFSQNPVVLILIGFFYYLERDMWDPWKPRVIKKFLANAKEMGL